MHRHVTGLFAVLCGFCAASEDTADTTVPKKTAIAPIVDAQEKVLCDGQPIHLLNDLWWAQKTFLRHISNGKRIAFTPDELLSLKELEKILSPAEEEEKIVLARSGDSDNPAYTLKSTKRHRKDSANSLSPKVLSALENREAVCCGYYLLMPTEDEAEKFYFAQRTPSKDNKQMWETFISFAAMPATAGKTDGFTYLIKDDGVVLRKNIGPRTKTYDDLLAESPADEKNGWERCAVPVIKKIIYDKRFFDDNGNGISDAAIPSAE